jgi:hypothetical protein
VAYKGILQTRMPAITDALYQAGPV